MKIKFKIRKKLSILIVILAIASLSTFAQEKYSDSKGVYTLNYFEDWKQIPNDILDKRFNKVQKSIKSDKKIKYDAGFQKRLSKAWLTSPYVLLNKIETGRLSDSDLKKMIGSFGKDIEELTEDKSYRYKTFFKKLKLNDSYYEEKRQRIISMMEFKTDYGNFTGLMIMNLTSFGSINLFFYTTPNKWDSQYQDFMDFADGLVISNEYNYKNESDNKYNKTTNITTENKESQLSKISEEKVSDTDAAVYPIFNFLFFAMLLIVVLFIIYRMNIGFVIIKFINQYKWFVVAIICLIFFLMQALIGGVIVLPLILNMILYYPLILYINYLSKFILKPLNSDVTGLNDFMGDTSKKEIISKKIAPSIIKDVKLDDVKDDFNKITITKANKMENNNSELQKNVDSSDIKYKEEQQIKSDELGGKISKKQKCGICNSEIEISDEEIRTRKYICPICYQENNAITSQNILTNNEPNGISGWLVFPALGIVLGFIRIFITSSKYLSQINSYIPSEIITFGLIKSAVLLIILIILAIQFFGKKKNAPALYIGFIVLNLLLLVIESAIIDSFIKSKSYYSFSISSNGMFGLIVVSIIWIFYFVLSKRVKNTFIN